MSAVELRPIAPADAARVAAFLHEHMNGAIAPEAWRHAIVPPWGHRGPNAGVMLLDGDAVVGALLALYSEPPGERGRFCNLGTWCVLPRYRLHSLRLLRRLLAQPGYHFTDLSPAPEVVRINEKLGFVDVDTRASLLPCLPWPGRRRGVLISSDPAAIERTLDGDDLVRYRDHAAAPAVRHVVLRAGDARCWVVLRRERRKGLPLFAHLLHVSDPPLLHRLARPFAAHLLRRHRVVACIAEERVAGGRLPGARPFQPRARRMYRSRTLAPDQLDYLYSELVCLPA